MGLLRHQHETDPEMLEGRWGLRVCALLGGRKKSWRRNDRKVTLCSLHDRRGRWVMWDGLLTLSQFLKCPLPVSLAPFPQLVNYRTYICMENRSKSHGRSFLKAVMEAVSQSSPRRAFVPSPTVLIQFTELQFYESRRSQGTQSSAIHQKV